MIRSRGVATGIALALTLTMAVGGCDNFLDVNSDPNSPESVRMDLTLPGILISFDREVMGYPTERYGVVTGVQGWGPLWMQQISYNRDKLTYSQYQWYEMSSGDANALWDDSYADVMQEAVNMMNATEPTEDWAYHGIAKFIYAWNASILTDSWGPIPFSEAFDTENRDPAYDSQQSVYQDVYRLLDEAIAEMQGPSAHTPAGNDLLYHGDMSKWVKLAYTVEARLQMHLAYAPGESAEDHAQKALDALQKGFTSNADDADFDYPGGSGARSTNYAFEDEGWSEQTVISQHYLELLQGLNDPRLPITVEPALSDGVYRGHVNGALSEADSTISKIGDYFTADSSATHWISYSEAKFIEAEARLILNGAAAADAPYREGIRANMEKMGVAPADIDAYIAARPPLSQVANPLEEIITQKYIANFLRGEVWSDWRRTGYPVLTPVADAVIDGIPQRLRTPSDELNYNAESVAETGIPGSLAGMPVKVWWASGSPPQ